MQIFIFMIQVLSLRRQYLSYVMIHNLKFIRQCDPVGTPCQYWNNLEGKFEPQNFDCDHLIVPYSIVDDNL